MRDCARSPAPTSGWRAPAPRPCTPTWLQGWPPTRIGVHPGDTVILDTMEDGKVPFTVALVGGPVPLMSPEAGVRYFQSYPLLYLVNARPGYTQAFVGERIREIYAQWNEEVYTTNNPKELFNSTLDWMVGIIQGLFSGLTALSGIIGGLAIVNTLLAAILERQREIGVLRALGRSRGQVRRMVVAEAGLLGLTGAGLGVAGGPGVSLVFGLLIRNLISIAAESAPDSLPLPWDVAGTALVAGPLLAMVAALYPAARVARVDPVEAMRVEGGMIVLPRAGRWRPEGADLLMSRHRLALRLALVSGSVFLLMAGAWVAIQAQVARDKAADLLTGSLERGLDHAAVVVRERLAGGSADDVTRLMALRDDVQRQLELLAAPFSALLHRHPS